MTDTATTMRSASGMANNTTKARRTSRKSDRTVANPTGRARRTRARRDGTLTARGCDVTAIPYLCISRAAPPTSLGDRVLPNPGLLPANLPKAPLQGRHPVVHLLGQGRAPRFLLRRRLAHRGRRGGVTVRAAVFQPVLALAHGWSLPVAILSTRSPFAKIDILALAARLWTEEVRAMSLLPKTARAAVVAEYGKPIEIRDLPVPREDELEPGALLVRVDVASICGSDVHQWDGMTQTLAPASLPIVLGHEMMGTVVAFGPGPREDSIGQPLKEGDRLLWTHVYCGQCHECRVQHTPTLCRRKKQYMRTNCERFPYLVGGFAQYCYVFPPSGRVRIPDDVPDGVAAAASCALRTVVHAFDRLGRIEPHQRVVIQGAGPLGLFATAVANHAGVSDLIVVGAPLTPVQAALFVRKQATVLGVQSADIGQFWKALEFVRRTASRYDFGAMLTTRYPLDRINEAIQSMRAFREIKPLVLPWTER